MTARELPLLREELGLFEGQCGSDGGPTWNLHDPVRNLFFSIDWPTFEILARWPLGTSQAIADSTSTATTLQVEASDVEAVKQFLLENQLCQLHDPRATEWLVKRAQAQRGSVWHWFLHHYLFFRIPLVRPDRWLTKQLPRVAPLFSRRFFQLTAIVLILGVFECCRQWAHFSATLIDTFTFKGIIGYAVALTFVKTLHELGHAFTAKRKGCRVPTMGVAFLVMWPVAYTDVNEVWKLKDRKDRLAVGAAGIVTELVVAAWASLAWALLPDGAVRSTVFLLATTTWISTLVINASPFMRFDGYFLLSDYLSFPNLHARAFALARWDLRERLFALKEPVPELLPAARLKGLIIFAWLVWIYRLALFLGIAILVYHFFIKLLGIVLFAVEIGVFVIQPVWREIAEWRKRAGSIRSSPRAMRSLLLLVALLLIGFAPWNSHVGGQGILRTVQYFPLHAPGPCRIVALAVESGGRVSAGQLLVALESPDLDYREQRIEERTRQLQWQVAVSGLDDGTRARQNVTREELVSAQTELSGAAQERKRYEIRAPFSGVLVDIGTELRPGVWVNKQERLGMLIDPARWQVETYLNDREIHRVRLGDRAKFYSEGSSGTPLDLRVVRIDPDATRQLHDPLLSSQHGGQILTRERNAQLVPEQAIYRVVLSVERRDGSAATLQAERGRVVIRGERRTLLGEFMRSALSVLIREANW